MNEMQAPREGRHASAPADRLAIPRTVWALGLVSMFMNISSEMIHALLPLFLTGTLGASVAMVGLIEGIGESTAQVVKVFSGYLFVPGLPGAFLGIALWGGHMALTQGLLAKLVAEHAPAALRAGPPSACSTSPTALRRLWRALPPGCGGTPVAPRPPSSPARSSLSWLRR